MQYTQKMCGNAVRRTQRSNESEQGQRLSHSPTNASVSESVSVREYGSLVRKVRCKMNAYFVLDFFCSVSGKQKLNNIMHSYTGGKLHDKYIQKIGANLLPCLCVCVVDMCAALFRRFRPKCVTGRPALCHFQKHLRGIRAFVCFWATLARSTTIECLVCC